MIFLLKVFVMVHIWKVFDNNVFLIFHRFGDNITLHVLYYEISKNCSYRSSRFWGCRFFDNNLRLDRITILKLTCRVADQILGFIMLVFFIIYLYQILNLLNKCHTFFTNFTLLAAKISIGVVCLVVTKCVWELRRLRSVNIFDQTVVSPSKVCGN